MKIEEDEIFIEVNRRAQMMSGRGNASLYAKETPEDQALIEKSVLQDWLPITNERFALGITGWSSNPDPKKAPDIFGYIGGKKINIECTEFVRGALLDELKTKKIETIHAGHGFQKAQWTECDFIDHLNERIDKKEAKYTANKVIVDFLLIHTDEHCLYPNKVEDWITRFNRKPSDFIRSAYFIMSYDPEIQSYPVFKLF